MHFRTILSLITAAALLAGCASHSPLVQPGSATGRHASALSSAHRSLGMGDRAKGDAAIVHYLDAAREALAVLDASPDSVEARAVYRKALGRVGPALFEAFPKDGKVGGYAIRVATPGNAFRPADFFRLIPADDVSSKGVKKRFDRPGIGAPLAGFYIEKNPLLAQYAPKRGFTAPVTLVADFSAPVAGVTRTTITLFDPDKAQTCTLSGHRYPLAADFTAALLAGRKMESPLISGLRGMFQISPEVTDPRLTFIEPYDPAKVPVLFVHGLMSTPLAWADVVNELNADPQIRKNFQVWAFGYPTGNPIAYSAMRMRQELTAAEQITKARRIVLIGHSMGGLLSRMQVTTSKRVIWDRIFGKNAASIYDQLPPDDPLKRALLIEADPKVARVIFIATPHRGSTLADTGLAAFGMRLIRIPMDLVRSVPLHLLDEMQQVATGKAPVKRRFPNSIEGLSPSNPLLISMATLPIHAPHHSIIGIRNAKPDQIKNSSDGVVPYWSSHLDTAESEITVPTDHGAFNHPNSVKEMKRILLEVADK